MGRIVFYVEPGPREIIAKPGETIQEALLRHKVDIGNSCGGLGTCTTCLIKVQSDLSLLEPKNELEREMSADRGLTENERLSCQLCPHADLVISID